MKKTPPVRTLRKKERQELLANAERAPDLYARLGWGAGEAWRLPDGRIVVAVDPPAGSTEVWPDFESLLRFSEECRAFAEEALRAARSGGGTKDGKASWEAGAPAGYDFVPEKIERTVGELFRLLDVRRGPEPYSDGEASRVSNRLKRLWKGHAFDEPDRFRICVYVGEAVRARTHGEWAMVEEDGSKIPLVIPGREWVEAREREAAAGEIPRRDFARIDAMRLTYHDLYDGAVPDLKGSIELFLSGCG